MSIATIRRAAFAIGNVNQPSPQHRSTTFMPARRPTARNTSEGSGHSASHQPAAGISVPPKTPGRFAIARLLRVLLLRPRAVPAGPEGSKLEPKLIMTGTGEV